MTTSILKTIIKDNVLHKYFADEPCPSGYHEDNSTFIQVSETDHCKDTTFSIFFAGIGTGVIDALISYVAGIGDQNFKAGVILVPPLVGAIAGAIYNEGCHFVYPQHKEAIWQEHKTCVTNELIINTGPIPEESF